MQYFSTLKAGVDLNASLNDAAPVHAVTHLDSTSVTTDANGVKVSETRYRVASL